MTTTFNLNNKYIIEILHFQQFHQKTEQNKLHVDIIYGRAVVWIAKDCRGVPNKGATEHMAT